MIQTQKQIRKTQSFFFQVKSNVLTIKTKTLPYTFKILQRHFNRYLTLTWQVHLHASSLKENLKEKKSSPKLISFPTHANVRKWKYHLQSDHNALYRRLYFHLQKTKEIKPQPKKKKKKISRFASNCYYLLNKNIPWICVYMWDSMCVCVGACMHIMQVLMQVSGSPLIHPHKNVTTNTSIKASCPHVCDFLCAKVLFEHYMIYPFIKWW